MPKVGGYVSKRFYRKILYAITAALLLIFTLITASPALAQELTPATGGDYVSMLPAALLLFFPLGLILLMSSAMPEAKAPTIAINLLVVWGMATLGYFLVGFAFQFGGIAQVTPDPQLSGLYWEWYPFDQSVEINVAHKWGVIALSAWLLSAEALTDGALRLFLVHSALVGAVAMIPAVVLAQRARWGTALITALLMGMFIYPLPGNWIWGGGWLWHVGNSLGLGHGFVDFGGAGMLFTIAAAVALMALLVFRQESIEPETENEVVVLPGAEAGLPLTGLTVYEQTSAAADENGANLLPIVPMPSAYLPILSLLGGGFLLLGWFGLSTGIHTPTAMNFFPAQAAVNGLLAALGGALTSAGYSWFTTRAVNPLMTMRGLVAGLIIAMAGAPFAPTWFYLGAGLVMGGLVPLLIYLFDQKLSLNDSLGVLTTYGISAVISLLLVGFFADGRAGQGWNGVGLIEYLGVPGQGVSGLVVTSAFVADWPGQLEAQLMGLIVILSWTLLLSFILFQTVNAISDAWARTGLELTLPLSSPTQQQTNEVNDSHKDQPAS